jgi:outer membrane protein OmpA-like peptidoglycan-associated protein
LIEGFTDSTGSKDYNLELSRRRAESVKDHLVSLGVNGDRISTKGYGERYPVASNDNPGGRQLNRRVEVTVVQDGVQPQVGLRR